MKKSLLALAVLGAFVGAASAQSSVTAFGVVDLSINQVKNGSTSITTMDSSQLSSNRLGFRGVEDLGGGLQAGFHLEAGMDNSIGNAGGSNALTPGAGQSTLFNRRSTIQLIGRWGEVRLGRDYNPSFWNTVMMDAYKANGWGEAADLMQQSLGSGTATLARTNNAVSYILPAGLGGLYGQVMWSVAEAQNGQKYQGGKIGWAAGPFDVVAGYGATTINGAADFKVTNFGASYDAKVAQFFALWNKNEWGAKSVQAYAVGTTIPVGAGVIVAAYTHADRAASGVANSGKADQIGLEYVYNLSKRTAMYAQYGHMSNSGAAGYVFGGTVGATEAAGGFKSDGYGVGLKHSF